jgi:periplasmic protein TonB
LENESLSFDRNLCCIRLGNDELNGKDIAELKEVITKAPEAEEKTYTMVEQMPQFPGGDRELLSFIAKNLHYPTIAQEKGIQGKVFVRFVVSAYLFPSSEVCSAWYTA